ncbi:MAG: T9SS type A sorting domain-containing protein [Bacteroidetes bacterium]|nr:T9SS type A sorting domain-containing protein [Bacteroidota bacterium]
MKTTSKFNVSAIFAALFVVAAGHSPATADNVIASGTNFIVLPGTKVVSSENLVVKSGATLDNSGTLILKKGLTNEYASPNSIGAGTAEFSGTSAQTISGQNIIQNLTANNAAGVTIGGNTRVNGTLTLTNGKVTLGSSNLLLGVAATIAGTPSATVMIIVTGTGELRKEFASGFTGAFSYPVGDDTGTPEYSPVTLTFTGGTFGAGNYTGVSLKNLAYPDPNITGNFLNRYWTLSQSGITNFTCNAAFQYAAADVTGNENLISCTKVNPSPWITYALTNAATHQLTASGVASFGSFTGVKSSTPPANQQLANILIPNGVTTCYDATQVLTVAGNGTTFLVENGGSVTFVAGGKISLLAGAKVNSGGYLHGYITANNTFCGSAANPIVAKAENSSELGVESIVQNRFIKVYPNPTTDIVVVELMGMDANAMTNITVYTLQGKQILEKTMTGDVKFRFSLSGKPVGMYLVHVQAGEKSEIAKVVKN